MSHTPRRVLVTGHLGYIGTVLVPMLLERGHEVMGLDTDLFRRSTFAGGGAVVPVPMLEIDVRDVPSDLLEGFDSVIHLAALSNDPLGDMDPALTEDLNHRAAVELARKARTAGVRRFVFSSTCSNYGASDDGLLDEESPFHPVTPYGVAKVAAEQGLQELVSDEFSPIVLRSGTACGLSPRVRFDLVLNNLTAWACATGRVHLKSDGAAWRPIVHVMDIARAFTAVLEADLELVHGRAFNVARTDQNHRVRDIARAVHEAIAGSTIEFGEGAGADLRNYRVDGDRLPRTLPDFRPTWTIESAAVQMRDAIRATPVSVEEFEGARYQRLAQVRDLMTRGEIDSTLRPTRPHGRDFVVRAARACCHGCGSPGLRPVLDLGSRPASDALLPPDRVTDPDDQRPLEVAWCPACTLVQILEQRPRERLFGDDYPYFASFSRDLVEHGRRNAIRLIDRLDLGPESLVVEPASNDGVLLSHFVERGIPVLGIDPAPRQVEASIERGVPAWRGFFDLETARRVRAEHGPADLLIANNVLAHASDLDGFVAGLAHLIAEEGEASIEFPWLRDLVAGNQFDTIYHEHLCYWTLDSVEPVLERHGLRLVDAAHLDIHGGSLRLSIRKASAASPGVSEELERLRGLERAEGVGTLPVLTDFAARVRDTISSIRAFLETRRAEGRRISGYGAAAKGTMLLNAIGADRGLVDRVFDRNPHKHDRIIPGTGIPVRGTDELREDPPDDLLILPWNFRDEIMRQEEAFHAGGGRFLVPIPHPVVI